MDVLRLSVLPAVLLLAMGLAACGNKADLFMPPPPEDDPVIEEDPGAGGRSAVEAVGDEAPVEPPVLPAPPPASDPVPVPPALPTDDE